MMSAPDRIWVQDGAGYEGQDIMIAQDGSEEWHKSCSTQYIRADLIPAMLAGGRDKALRDAAEVVRKCIPVLHPEGPSSSEAQYVYEELGNAMCAVLALIPKGGDAL